MNSVRITLTLLALQATAAFGQVTEIGAGVQTEAAPTGPDSTWRSQLNGEMKQVLDVYEPIAGTPITELSPTLARQQFSAQDAAKIVARGTGKAPNAERVVQLIDGMTVPGPGGPLPVRVYTPAGAGPFPLVVYFHGGGFVIATLDTYDASARALANASGAVVISVEYRKAPEARFPAALEDAIAAYRWIVNHPAKFNGNADEVAVAGESAGGNLATEICLAALEGKVPMPVHQLLVYPVTDFNTGYGSDTTYADAKPLSTPALVYFTQHYLSAPSEATDWRASPIRASLSGMAPATIIAAQIDPLLDEGKAYADRLAAAGVSVSYHLYTGVTHEFFGMGAVVQQAKDAEALAGANLRKAFGQ
jgi:acetyl esterase